MMPDARSVSREAFGTMPDGRLVERVRLRGSGGFEVCIVTYGAAIQALFVPDRDGKLADVVLGHDTIEPYLACRRYFGATVGRYANRIAGGAFTLDGMSYSVALNDGPNGLHGGLEGFDRKLWIIEEVGEDPSPFVTLSHVSGDGEEGYPGELRATVTYSVSSGQELSISYSAVTSRPTIVNMTNHSFFNLAGVEAGASILDHVLSIQADTYLPVDATAIPLGRPENVSGTPFDFRGPRKMGERIREAHGQLALGRGYDHNFCLGGGVSPEPRLAARVEEEAFGRAMELWTDQPGLQFYSGNFLDGRDQGKYGRLYRQSDAFCLEPQKWPDSPNRKEYPTSRLDPGSVYRHTSRYRFYTNR